MAKKYNYLGAWAFLIAAVLALSLGILVGFNIFQGLTEGQARVMMYMLVGLGVVVGLLNITAKESMPFLASGVSLVLVGALGKDVLAYVPIAQATVVYLLMIFVPATIVVAVKNVFVLAKD